MSFDFARGERSIVITILIFHYGGSVFRAIRLEADATAAETVTLKTTRPIARHLFVIDASDIALAEWTIDGEIVAGLDLVFCAEVDVDDVVARDRLAGVFRHHQPASLLAGGIDEKIEIAVRALHRRLAVGNRRQQITKQR